MQNDLVAMSSSALSETLTDDEENALKIKLWQLMSRRTKLYTMGDSSSVRIETAQELFQSICFCLDLYLKQSGNSKRFLLACDLDELFDLSIKAVEQKIKVGKRLYQIAYATALSFENISYQDTLISIGSFFRKYDYRFFAHTIPCDIDYQLYYLVEDEFKGIEYINEYLRRLIIENDFINRFDKTDVEDLLRASCPDYKGLLINIYEPVAVNALGLALLNKNVRTLDISDDDRDSLINLFDPLTVSPAKKLLEDAAQRVCSEIGMTKSYAEDYVIKTAKELYPRLSVALSNKSLERVFQTINNLESHA